MSPGALKALPELAMVQGDPGDRLSRLEEAIRAADIEIEYGFAGYGALGVSTGGRIIIQPDLPPAQTFAILIHEVIHEILHHQSGRRKELSRATRETEAEAVAHVVCRACGLDPSTSSSDSIHLSHGDAKILSESLDIVQRTVMRIIGMIDDSKADDSALHLAA